MSTANCPCCGNKEPVPGGAPGRRLICSNCGTPFVPGAEPPPPPPQAEDVPVAEAVEAVHVEPPLPPRKKTAPPPRPTRRRKAEDDDAVPTAVEVETALEDDPDVLAPPSAGRSPKKSKGGCLLSVGIASFLGVLLCGGLGIGGYFFLRPYLDNSVAENTEKDGDGTEKKPAARETEFVDAGKAARLGDVRVSVSSAVVDLVTGTEGGEEFRSAEKLLAIKVRIDNLSDTRKVEYTGWGAESGGDDLPRLTDDRGNPCKLVTFGGNRRVAGQVRSESIGPKQTVNDVLVFDPPAADARALMLELPAHNFGGTGKVGFKVPRSMIRFGDQAEGDRSRSVPQLIEALKGPDAKARLAAANTLAARGPAAALASKQLGENLKDSDPAVRLAAAQALGKIGPTAHVAYPALVRALGDGDGAVRKAARESLEKIGRPFREDIPELSAALKDPNATVRVFALQTLLGMELDAKTAAPLYAAVLKDADRGMRLEAARALGKVGPKGREAAFAALLEAQRDADPEVRKAASDALAGMGPGAAGDVAALRAALKEKAAPPELRARAAQSLGALGAGARDAVPELADALHASEVPVRRAAAAALAQVGPGAKGALVELIEALGDKDKAVRKSALEAVGKLGPDGKRASADVSDLVADADPETRKAAGRTLVQIDPDAALAAYSRALFNGGDAVRLEAAEVLLTMGAAAKPRTADLIAALGDKSPAVRLKVARALTQVDPTTTAPVRPLAELLSGTDAAIRREAADALAALGLLASDAVPALGGALKDKDPAVRKSAAVALSKVGEPARPALAALVVALDDAKLREPVLAALKNIGPDKAVPPLIKALKDKELSVRLASAEALAQFGEDAADAVKPLNRAIEAEKDADAKKALRAALKRIKPE